MIFDFIAIAFFFFEVKRGFSDGFVKSLLKATGYIAGAIAGLYIAIQYNRSGWIIIAIFFGAGAGTMVGSLIAKALKVTILRGPLAWLNAWAGALLHGAKALLLTYLIGTVLLWAPWSTGQNAVAESKLYLKINSYAPAILVDLREKIEEKLQ